MKPDRALRTTGPLLRFHHWFAPLLCGLIVFFATMAYYRALAREFFDGHRTGLIRVGREFVHRGPPLPIKLHIDSPYGFDGQFFFFLALDPLLRQPATLARLDAPFLRARRIAYPTLIALTAAGDPHRMPRRMLLLNALAVAATTALLAITLRARRGSPWPSLLFPIGLFVLMSHQYLTSEALAMAAVAGSMFAHVRRRPGWALALAMLAGLAKEMALLWPAVLVLDALLRRDLRRALLYSAAPLPLFAWCAWLHWGIGLAWSSADDTKNFGLPFVGPLWQLKEIAINGGTANKPLYRAASVLLILVILAAPWCALRRILRERSPEHFALLIAALLAASLPARADWWHLVNYPRQHFMFALLLGWVGLTTPRRTREPLFWLWLLTCLATVLYLLEALD